LKSGTGFRTTSDLMANIDDEGPSHSTRFLFYSFELHFTRLQELTDYQWLAKSPPSFWLALSKL
jgi:hypothetical protein